MQVIVRSFLFLFLSTIWLSCGNSKKSSSAKIETVMPKTPAASLTETYWKLTELIGKPMGITPADKKEIHMKLRKETGNVEGFGGCNGFGGSFVTKNEFNI